MNGARTDGMNIAGFFGFLRRRALIIVLCVLAGAAVAYLVSKAQDDEYTATAKLLLKGQNPQNSNQPDFQPGVPATAPDREALVTRGAVLKITERRLAGPLGRTQAEQVTKDLKALSGEDSAVISLTATAPTARGATLGANTLAAANIAYRKAQTQRA